MNKLKFLALSFASIASSTSLLLCPEPNQINQPQPQNNSNQVTQNLRRQYNRNKYSNYDNNPFGQGQPLPIPLRPPLS